MKRALAWKPGTAPAGDEAPYAWAAMNVLIQYGPISAKPPNKPDAGRQDTATKIVELLDPLVWPIYQHSVVSIPSRTPAPTAAPSASPVPSAAPSKAAKPTPKPSKQP